ncbi:hypothetical protein Tco_0133972 [Tanacetum coccineum]
MHTRSSSNLVGETSTNPKRRNRRRSKQKVEPFSLEENPVVTDGPTQRYYEHILLQSPTEGFRRSILWPWERFKDLLRACPHHGFTKLHQLDTFYNALTLTDQDSLNAATGGNLLTKTPRDALTIIENKLKVHNSRNKPVVTKVSRMLYLLSSTLNFQKITLCGHVKALGFHEDLRPQRSFV